MEGLRPGDHVIAALTPSCGECPMCLEEKPYLCAQMAPTMGNCTMIDGTTRLKLGDRPVHQLCAIASFAERAVIPAGALVKVENDVALDVVCLIGCGVTTGAGAALNTARVEPGTSVAVIGCGGVGLSIIQGARIAGALLEQGFDVAYAYEPLHHPGLPHAFMNTVLFLDYERRGFPHRVVPFQINCYGRRVIPAHGGMASLAEPLTPERLDPPSPSSRRCFDLGAACARALAASPWRVAMIASSSWSHAFLTEKNHYLHPDIPADRALYEALVRGDYGRWRDTPLRAVEDSGQQEMLNWFALVGAMAELGRKPDGTVFIETWVFNSNKCFAIFRP